MEDDVGTEVGDGRRESGTVEHVADDGLRAEVDEHSGLVGRPCHPGNRVTVGDQEAR
jgi:hypothetical protein